MDLEKSLFAIQGYLTKELNTVIKEYNNDITDDALIPECKQITVARYDLDIDGIQYPRINLILDRIELRALTLGADEAKERLIILIGLKGTKQENLMLKTTRFCEAVRKCFLQDSTAGDSVEFISTVSIKLYLPVEDLCIAEIGCDIQRQIQR